MTNRAELRKYAERALAAGLGGSGDPVPAVIINADGVLSILDELDAKDNTLLALTTRHFAESWSRRSTDAKLDEYLSAGIAQLQEERDAALAEIEIGEKWRELALQFDMHRMQAMALIRMVASGAASSSQCYEFAARAPIPGHEITERLAKAETERDAALAELEACRKDAERWRFVRSPLGTRSPYAVWQEGRMPVFSAIADACIDAAMSQEANHA